MSPEGITQQTNNVSLEPTFVFTGTFPFTLLRALLEYKRCGESSRAANMIAMCKKAQHLASVICCLAVDISRAPETKWGQS